MSTLPSFFAKWFVLYPLVGSLDLFGTMPGFKNWLENEYMPDAEKAIGKISVSWLDSFRVFTKFNGTLIKLFWAFSW